jgi:ketosteroid isomerase-like protein
MGYSLQELSDKQEIQELAYAYSEAIDQQQFDRLDTIFTPDAWIDYTALGGEKGSYPEIKQFLQNMLPMFKEYYHLISNVHITLNGDSASARIMCLNPMGLPVPDKPAHMMFLGLFYLDEYVRTAEGWRICKRVEERSWGYNVPKGVGGA